MHYELEHRFVESASEHGRATLLGTAEEINEAYDHMLLALRELRKLEDKGISVLLNHLHDEDLSVVMWSALFLLPHREEDAVAALQRVAQSGERHTGFSAEMTLREWRAGRLKIE